MSGIVGRAPAPPTNPTGEDTPIRIIDAGLKFNGTLKPITEKIEKLIQHHMAHPGWDVREVHRYHRDKNGWYGIGYNYWIAFDGTVYQGRGRHVGAHAGAAWNGRSLGIGYQGDFERQQMTDAQVESGARLNALLMQQEGLQIEDIIGHNEAAATHCPGKNFRMAELRGEVQKITQTGGDPSAPDVCTDPGDGIKDTQKGGDLVVTPISGKPRATVEQAKTWARNRNATERFINNAEYYWQLAPKRNLRPEVLYVQSSRETGNGHFGRLVTPEMNNWAGIKKEGLRGEIREDHESFPSDYDGIRAHVNHICAYVGRDPIGEPHGRYHTVMSLEWAGTVKYVEQLGGKYAPNPAYGTELVELYLTPLLETVGEKSPEELPPGEHPTGEGETGETPECPVCQALETEMNQLQSDYLMVSNHLSRVKKRKDELEMEVKKAASILNHLL